MFNATQTENVDHVEFVVTPSGRTHTTQDAHAGFHSVFHSRLDKHENSWLPLRCSLLAPRGLRQVTFCTACLDCAAFPLPLSGRTRISKKPVGSPEFAPPHPPGMVLGSGRCSHESDVRPSDEKWAWRGKRPLVISKVVSRLPTANATLKSRIFPEAELLSKDVLRHL